MRNVNSGLGRYETTFAWSSSTSPLFAMCPIILLTGRNDRQNAPGYLYYNAKDMKLFSGMSRGLIFSLATAFLWACSLVNTRYLLLKGEDPLNLTVWIGLIMIPPWIYILGKHREEYQALSPKFKWYLVGIGVISSVGLNYLQSITLLHSPAANFAFLYRTIVVFTIILAYIFFKEAISVKKWILAGLILFGSFLLTTNGKGIHLTTGDIYTLVYALSAAFISNILIKHTISRMHPDISGAAISIVSSVALFIFAVGIGALRVSGHIPFIILGSALSLGITMVRNRAYKHATASFVTMIVSLTPVFVTILSYPLLHERLDVYQLLGGAVIVGSMFFVERFKI